MAAPMVGKTFHKIYHIIGNKSLPILHSSKRCSSSHTSSNYSSWATRFFRFTLRNKAKITIFSGVTVASYCFSSYYHQFKDNLQSISGSLIAEVNAAEPYNPDKKENAPSRRAQFNFIADVVSMVSPSVVFIDIQGRHPFSGEVHTVSNGSGFIVREDGLILTNAHVVANKKYVHVTLADGRKLEGHVEAVDPITDLATVKIDVKGLKPMKLGKSSDVQPGEWVVAMGSPFTLNNTVTAGIISTVGRGSKELGMHFKDMQYIQTDAVINFGNSGGPLVNLDGEAIGINTMKVTTGISFAIPSDYAVDFLERAGKLEERKAAKGWFGKKASEQTVATGRKYMGVTMLTLTPNIILELQNRMDFPDVKDGVFIHKVIIGSPAHHGGIHPGDILTHINGSAVKSAKDVYKAINENNELKITIIRGHQQVFLKVKPEHVE